MATGRHISLPKPFASGDINEWCQRFEICSKANEWDDGTMALKLPTLLEGEALAVWMELTEEQQKNYVMAKKEMVAKMVPVGFISLYHWRTSTDANCSLERLYPFSFTISSDS